MPPGCLQESQVTQGLSRVAVQGFRAGKVKMASFDKMTTPHPTHNPLTFILSPSPYLSPLGRGEEVRGIGRAG